MTTFDAIATQTVRKAAHLEPGFVDDEPTGASFTFQPLVDTTE